MYKLGFVLSFLMGALVYYVCALVWPMEVYPVVDEGEEEEGLTARGPDGFEAMAPSEGFFPGESVAGIRGVLEAGVVEVRGLGEEGMSEKSREKV